MAINQIIYSELGAGMRSIEEIELAFPAESFDRLDLPWDAAFLAGQAHRMYRRDGGSRDRTLPDFLIGAHAAVAGLTLITRDPKRYRRHFPRLAMIAPDTHFPELAPTE